MHNLRIPHLEAIYRTLRYLKFAPRIGILFSNHGHFKVEAFTDANWAGSVEYPLPVIAHLSEAT